MAEQEEGKIVAYKVTEEEYKKLEGLAQLLYKSQKLPKPSVNALAKSFTFVVTNQFIQIQNQMGMTNA
jgi:hypothetical protein